MKIGDVAKQTGLSVHTIRYYERIGLLPFAMRDNAGQRVYDNAILAWIEFLGRLKTTGMSIQGMLHYAKLRAAGLATEAERKALLVEHRDKVRHQIAELQASLLVLDNKIAGYANNQRRMSNDKREQASQGANQRQRGKPAAARKTGSGGN
jgi:DNA-binding transcriptional MerR regulator